MDEHHKKVEIMQGAELHKIAQKENYAASSSQHSFNLSILQLSELVSHAFPFPHIF